MSKMLKNRILLPSVSTLLSPIVVTGPLYLETITCKTQQVKLFVVPQLLHISKRLFQKVVISWPGATFVAISIIWEL